MEWWRGALVGLAVAALTAGLGGVICKKGFALGWATAALICSKLSTRAATWFGKKWLWPFMTNFRNGYKARCDEQPELDATPTVEAPSGRKKGVSGFQRAQEDRERRGG